MSLLDQTLHSDDKLTNEIFSILENKFLFGHNSDKLSDMKPGSKNVTGRVRILSIDGGGATSGLLAAASLAKLESFLKHKSGNPDARIADFFDVAAGSGAGAALAAALFTRRRDAGEALALARKIAKPESFVQKMVRPARVDNALKRAFGEGTLKDADKSVLIPCYDLKSHAPFLFSRADAVETDGYDFKMRDVCLASLADPTVRSPVAVRSVDGRTRILAVGGGVAMNNPTAAAITHVLNNKQEFPFCNGVEDLLVVSLGNGESTFDADSFLRISGEGTSDMVDQAVSMAFGQSRATNYVRIQGNGIMAKNMTKKKDVWALAEEMLGQKNVESVLFEGKKMVESTNSDKLEIFAGELIKEEERRKVCILPTVVLKQSSSSPRTSSATTLSSSSSY